MENKEPENTIHYQFKNEDEWRKALSKAPNAAWIMQRNLDKDGNKKSSYVPLFVQQALSELFFREFDIVKNDFKPIANEILCTVEISFLPDFPDALHRKMVGVAAKPIQQKGGSQASSFPDGKISNALEYNSPAAQSAAVSNALTNFANIFGRNLNRKVRNDYSMTEKKKQENG